MKLVVVRRAGVDLTEDALLRWCVAELPYFMVPRFIEFREDLPRTPTQKIRKVDLRAEGIGPAAWDREEAGWRLVRGRLERAEDQAAP
jgi:crotonobetaine/carnitine-CoA ligase